MPPPSTPAAHCAAPPSRISPNLPSASSHPLVLVRAYGCVAPGFTAGRGLKHDGYLGDLVVDGDESTTVDLQPLAVTPSSGDTTTAYANVLDQYGEPEANVTVQARLHALPSGDTGIVADGAVYSATSDANGLVQFPGLLKGATYHFRRGQGRWQAITIPASAGSSYGLPSFYGED